MQSLFDVHIRKKFREVYAAVLHLLLNIHCYSLQCTGKSGQVPVLCTEKKSQLCVVSRFRTCSLFQVSLSLGLENYDSFFSAGPTARASLLASSRDGAVSQSFAVSALH